MFNCGRLLDELKSGILTRIHVDGTGYLLSSATDFQVSDDGCSGVLGDILRFSFTVKENTNYADFTLSFSAVEGKKAEIGEIELFRWSESECNAAPERCIFEFQDSLEDQFVRKAASNDGKHMTKPMCLVYDLSRKENFFAGQLTFDKNMFVFDMEFDPADSRLKSMVCRIPGTGYLCGEEPVSTDTLSIAKISSGRPYDLLCRWADRVKEIYKVQPAEKIVAGFITGLLVSPKAEISTSQIRRQLNSSRVQTLQKLGMDYLWISLDNIKDTIPGNWLYPNEKKFPEGLQEFLKEVQEKGMRPGFWIGFFQMCENALDFEKAKNCLIRKKDGTLSERGSWSWENTLVNGHFPIQYSIDPGKKESLDYIGNVFSSYADWGIRYHMVDFLDTGLYHAGDDTTGYDREEYLKFMRKIKTFCHPETQLLSASGSTLSFVGAVQTSRIGLDYGEGRPLEKFYPSYPATYVINGSFASMGSPNRNAVNNLAMWAFAHDRFFQCNSNMMTVDKPIPLNEAQVSATLFGISPSPVFFGDDMDQMAEDRLDLIKKVLPRCPGMPEPVDLFHRWNGEDDFLRTFVLKVTKPWGSWYVCGIFNLNDSYRKLELTPDYLNIPSGKKYRMYNFWQESYCGIFEDSKWVEIPANSAAVFRLEEQKEHPWILSTDMHVRQGDAELESVSWDPETRTLSGIAKRTPGETGNLFIIADDSFIPENANRGLMVSKSAIDMSIIIKKAIHFEHEKETWSIHFDE